MGKNNRSRKRKPTPQPPPFKAEAKVGNGRFLSLLGLSITIITAVGLLYTGISYLVDPSSALSIGPASPVFEPQPYSLPFELKNESHLLPVADIRFSCNVPDMETSNGPHDYNLEIRLSQLRAMWIGPGQTKTAHCENSVFFGGSTPGFANLAFSLKVTFRPFPYFWSRTLQRDFRAVIDPTTRKFGRWTSE